MSSQGDDYSSLAVPGRWILLEASGEFWALSRMGASIRSSRKLQAVGVA